ncbi:hypothetical protein TWF696_009008 [Orbilia brochopaga]|uniref:Uncharacterized protein n=1 Tax=Orbilia brochopaga TaxID=3140254 RepID=A0AAV9UHH2_9PEZI
MQPVCGTLGVAEISQTMPSNHTSTPTPTPTTKNERAKHPPSQQNPDTRGSNRTPNKVGWKIAVGITSFALLAILVILVIYFFRRKIRRRSDNSSLEIGLRKPKARHPEHKYNLDLQGSASTNTTRGRGRSLAISNSSRTPNIFKFHHFACRFPPLDDFAILKALSELENRITDHVINFWHSGSVTSVEYQTYIRSPESRSSWTRILHNGRPLLVDLAARTQMFRAILGYHVYTAIADWRVFFLSHEDTTAEQITNLRRHICQCGEDETSGISIAERARFIYGLLETASEPHLSAQSRNEYLEPQRESLSDIAQMVTSISFQLAPQPDDFRFEFRNKDDTSISGRDLYAIRLLGEAATEVDMSAIEVVNGVEDGTVRALIAPGVIRIPRKNKNAYVLRKAQVWIA